MTKPIVFNYANYESVLEENRKLKEDIANLKIRCRIAEADRPIVIKSKTLMPTKDFKEWAKRIKEVNPNVIVIPCDAEAVSTDRPKGEWVEPTKDKDYWECSECHDRIVLEENVTPKYVKMHFCPNCGADMRGEADAEEK